LFAVKRKLLSKSRICAWGGNFSFKR